MGVVITIAVVVAPTYAVNTWKIRMLSARRAVAAAALEALQGFAYLIGLLRILDGPHTWPGIAAYVVGAGGGTLIATYSSRRDQAPDHHHPCCPQPDGSEPLLPSLIPGWRSARPPTPIRPAVVRGTAPSGPHRRRHRA